MLYEIHSHEGVLSPREATALNFSVKLLLGWSVVRIELRDSDILLYGSNFPKEEGRLACIIDGHSGQRFSSAVIVDETLLRCQI